MLKNAKFKFSKINLFFITLLTYSLVFSFFSPILNIKILDKFKNLNGLFFLLNNDITFLHIDQHKTFNLPFLLKFSILVSVLLVFIAAITYLKKKYTFCSIVCFLSAFAAVFFVFAIGDLKKNILDLNISVESFSINLSLPYFISIALKITIGILAILKKGKEKLFESIFFSCCAVSLTIVLSIFIFIAIYGSPSFFKIGFFNFIFNSNWNPALQQYGILNLLLGSIAVTIGAILISTPISVLAATFLNEIANKKFAAFFNAIIEILASIPSVIYGLFGMTTIVPFIKKTFSKQNSDFVVVGDSLLAAILVLSIMIIPTILSTSYLALKNNSKSLKEASFNLGATRTQTIFKVSLRAAKFGIISGVTLAIAKAFGETMAVIMVAGNVPNSINLLKPVRLLTTGIAIDISYSSGLLRQALFGIGLVLFVLIILINLSFKKITKKKI